MWARPRVCGFSCRILRRAGSELEWPTKICPLRNDEEWERSPKDICDDVSDNLPSERWDDVVLKVSFRSLLQRGQKVALMNQRSTHFAWKTCEQSSTLQMSGTEALNGSWQMAQPSCLYVDVMPSFQTTSSLCCTKASGMSPRGMVRC